MEILINEEKEKALCNEAERDRTLRGLQSGTSDEPRNMGDLGNRGADMQQQQMLENIT